MPKLRQAPVSADDLERYLHQDDDFAFELRCLHALREQGIHCAHGGTYDDPVTRKPRQFDLRAKIKANALLRVHLAIECKNLTPAFPLLVSRVPRAKAESFHELLVPKERPDEQFLSAIQIDKVESARVSRDSLYRPGGPVGKSIARIGISLSGPSDFVSDDSEIYERWAQSVASAYDLVSDGREYLSSDDAEPQAFWILPVLVGLDVTGWSVVYDSVGAIASKPLQSDHVEYFLDHSVWRPGQLLSYQISHLHIMTMSGLLRLVQRLQNSGDEFHEQLLSRELITHLVNCQ